jgi:hypothetical protein
VDAARAEVETARAETEAAQRDAERARLELEDARVDIEKDRAELESARTAIANARAEVAAARGEAELARSDAANARREVETARGDANEKLELSRATRLIDAIRTLDEARSISDLLDRLLECVREEVDRAAVLVVKSDRLTGWRLTGFPKETTPGAKSIDLSVEDAGLAGVVLQTGTAASRAAHSGDTAAFPAFAADAAGRDAMAFPILVGGEVVAVLYADSSDGAAAQARWATTLEVIARHGSRVLEAITVLHAAGLPLPQPMAQSSHTGTPAAVEHA